MKLSTKIAVSVFLTYQADPYQYQFDPIDVLESQPCCQPLPMVANGCQRQGVT